MRIRLCVVVWVIALWSLCIVGTAGASRWSIQPTPNPAGATGFGSTLRGVSCPSVRDCTAVGYYETGNTYLALAQRWEGRSWKIQPTPNPAGALNTVLRGVSCSDASDCMAVGNQQASTFNSLTVAERWNGSRWQLQSPPRTGELLESVSCPTRRHCVAVGYGSNFRTLAEVWNGTNWSVQPTPNPPATAFISAFSDISCSSPSACTAVGDYETSTGRPPLGGALERPHVGDSAHPGSSRRPVRRVVPDQPGLHGRGRDLLAKQPWQGSTLAERWNGATWEIQPTPNHAGSTDSELGKISCPTRRTCVALGGYRTSPGITESFTEVGT